MARAFMPPNTHIENYFWKSNDKKKQGGRKFLLLKRNRKIKTMESEMYSTRDPEQLVSPRQISEKGKEVLVILVRIVVLCILIL